MVLTIPERLVFAIVLAGTCCFCAYRGYLLTGLVRMGAASPLPSPRQLRANSLSLFADVFLHRKLLRKPIVGVLHFLVLYGFLAFSINSINHAGGAFVQDFSLLGDGGLSRAYATATDIFALLLILGAGGLAFRRYVIRPESLTPRSIESALVFTAIIGAMFGYLWVHAQEIALSATGPDAATIDSPHLVAQGLATLLMGLPSSVARVSMHVAWWMDALFHLALLCLMFYPTKHLHLFTGPLNLLLKNDRPRGHLSKIDFEDENAETFGVAKIEEFSWKQNLDLLACIECGRCQDFCPTYNSGKPLRPKHLIVDLQSHLLSHGRKVGTEEAEQIPSLIVDTISEDTIWACTTCGACVEHCPMGIQHVDKIVDMRRNLTLMESRFPESATATFRNMESAGNPWGFPQSDRAAWAEGLDVPLMSEKKEADILFWVGCSGSYDDRNKDVTKAVAKLLKAAEVDFAILGNEERCNCESARRLGNEYLYQTATEQVVDTLGRYTFNRILVICPHCMNTFSNEYPDFGGDYEVIHHTEFIEELVASGKMPAMEEDSAAAPVKTVFHDSCYLGRINGVMDAPRNLIEQAGRDRVGVAREREKGLCCGAGGGRMWLEESLGEPINGIRVRELLDSGADEIAASCPYCITMLSDAATRESGGKVQVRDVAEIFADRIAPKG